MCTYIGNLRCHLHSQGRVRFVSPILFQVPRPLFQCLIRVPDLPNVHVIEYAEYNEPCLNVLTKMLDKKHV